MNLKEIFPQPPRPNSCKLVWRMLFENRQGSVKLLGKGLRLMVMISGKIGLSSLKLTTFSVLGTLLLGSVLIAPAAAAVAKEGEAVYAAKCKTCHGADGAGNPAIAKMMNVTLKPLGSADVQAKTDADLKAGIAAGTGKMKPVAGVSGADADNIVAYLRTFKK